MTNFNFEYKGTFLRYKDSNGNLLDLNGSQVDTDLDERTEQNETDIAALQHYFDSISVKEDASGGVASFADGADNIPVKSLVVNIVPIQEGTGDPSPENVRPISGRQIVTVTRAGVNVWDEEWESGTYLNTSGTKYPSSTKIRNVNPISVKPNTTYFYYVGSTTADEDRIWCYDSGMNFIRSFVFNHQTSIAQTFTTPENCAFINFAIKNTTYNHDISINYPATDTAYHPGTVASVEVQLGQTVYGGTSDVTNGILTKTWDIIESYDGETLSGEWISDRDVYAEGTTPTTGAQVCYKLETPVEIQLSPQQLTTILGTNNIWSDAGNVAVNYVANTKLYIDSAIAASADSAESVNANNSEEVKETVNEIEKPDVIEEKEVKDDNVEEEKEI